MIVGTIGIVLVVLVFSLIIVCMLHSYYKQLYVYPKNGHVYLKCFSCKMKNPNTGDWLIGICYKDIDTGYYYVREIEDFHNKFVKYKEYKNGNSSK